MAIMEAAVYKSALKVVDKFTDLLKFRHERRREDFTTVVDPLFNDLLTMHTDYMEMFDECQAALLEGKPLQEIANSLAQRRRIYDGLRVKSRAFIVALKDFEMDAPYKAFLTAAAYHIPDGALGPVSSTPASMILEKLYGGLTLIDAPHRKDTSSAPGDRRHLLDAVIESSNNIRRRLSWICEEYVKAKVWSLK
jgi:hypothetical protein